MDHINNIETICFLTLFVDCTGPLPATLQSQAVQEYTHTMQEICVIPQTAAITSVDAASHPVIGSVASGRSEIASLALWLMAERQAPTSSFSIFVDALPVRSYA